MPDWAPICTVTVGVSPGLVELEEGELEEDEIEEDEPFLLQPVMVASVTTMSRSPTETRRALMFATLFLPQEKWHRNTPRLVVNQRVCLRRHRAHVASPNADAPQISYLLMRVFCDVNNSSTSRLRQTDSCNSQRNRLSK